MPKRLRHIPLRKLIEKVNESQDDCQRICRESKRLIEESREFLKRTSKAAISN